MEVFIATPTYDEWVSIEHATSLVQTGYYLAQAGIGMTHAVAPGNPFLDMARNDLVEKFLASDADTLLFIDADVGWSPEAVTRVLSYEEEVVGGLVPKRDAQRSDVYHDNAICGPLKANGLIGCMELPTAFLAIKRSAFEKLQKPYFKIGSNPKDFGEDIYFCRRWTELGEKMWIDPDINFSHRGGKVWKGNFYDHAIKSGLIIQREAA